ncbi:hypothetical protein O181_097368 [Austropuccinia psidii MF-1]|uniref:Tet-like 2OG-Fe(II) oxygenase domain-containing protein n=1 Tax=Austropuccinia psidii MF-1 TaxID=1389203 RepID=A0A9Q3J8T1_9BASI|nr:hypothetical protein [Austropuccinia psidii MF-1]
MFSSTGLLIALVEFRPFTTMSEVKVNQWDELSQLLFNKRKFTNPIATNGALLKEVMFGIGRRKCSMKNKKFCLYGSLRKIGNAKDEWLNQGGNVSLMGCMLDQSLRYVEDKLFQKIQTCYKQLGLLSFDQVNYKANTSANQGNLSLLWHSLSP